MSFIEERKINIKVIGIGGAGVGAVNYIAESDLKGIEYFAIDTNIRKMSLNEKIKNIQIGERTTGNSGTGGNIELGERAVRENIEEIEEMLKGTELLFLTTGLGGGTGSGAVPIIGEIAKKLNILTIVVATSSFTFEGKERKSNSDKAIEKLKNNCDILIKTSNDKLFELPNKKITLENAFKEADEILRSGIASISELITETGLINVDFADLLTITKNSGDAVMGYGVASGPTRVEDAIDQVISNPLLERNLKGAKNIIINIIASSSLKINEVKNIGKVLEEKVGFEIENLIFGVTPKEELGDSVKVVLVATNF